MPFEFSGKYAEGKEKCGECGNEFIPEKKIPVELHNSVLCPDCVKKEGLPTTFKELFGDD